MTEDITLTSEDDAWVITHEPSGLTTQGESRVHALLMLVDAMYANDEGNPEFSLETTEEPLRMAARTFVMCKHDQEQLENIVDGEDNS